MLALHCQAHPENKSQAIEHIVCPWILLLVGHCWAPNGELKGVGDVFFDVSIAFSTYQF